MFPRNDDPPQISRRQMLREAGIGFGLLGLTALLAEEAAGKEAGPLAARPPHHAPRARRCIFLYLPGGPSQLDLFDPKPRVTRDHGKPLPFEKPRLERTRTGNLFASPWKF